VLSRRRYEKYVLDYAKIFSLSLPPLDQQIPFALPIGCASISFAGERQRRKSQMNFLD
jgi:hypothetical protein